MRIYYVNYKFDQKNEWVKRFKEKQKSTIFGGKQLNERCNKRLGLFFLSPPLIKDLITVKKTENPNLKSILLSIITFFIPTVSLRILFDTITIFFIFSFYQSFFLSRVIINSRWILLYLVSITRGIIKDRIR